MNIIDQISRLFLEHGSGLYFGEQVTETDHALQCAAFARASNASDELIVACLLHDIGHLLHGLSQDIADKGIDGQHELLGARWLADKFPACVVDPVRLHVDAKRYLSSINAQYRAGLSKASELSLQLQGGPMCESERQQFELEPFFKEAIQLRLYDDAAKIKGKQVPGFESYRDLLSGICIKEIHG